MKIFQWHLALLGLMVILLFPSCGRSPTSESKKEGPEEIQQAQETSDASKEAVVTDKELKHYQALLEDPHTVIRLAAARVLLAYGDRSGEGALLEALKGDDTRHRIDAFLALSTSLTEETVPALQDALEDEENPMARYVMQRTLKKALKELKTRP